MKSALQLLKHPAVISIIIINSFFVILGAYYNYTSFELLTRYTKEDGFIEWMQFLVFSIASLWMFFVTYERIKRGESLRKLENLGILGLAFLFLFGSLEEVSWFQRIADIQAGEFFLQHNKQAETNLHNLKVGEVGINKLIFGKILFLCILSHNVIFPLISLKKPKLRAWVERKGFFLPPLPLVAIYLGLVILVELFVSHRREKEILEVLGAIHYLTACFLTYGLGFGYAKPIFTQTEEKRRIAIVFSMALFFLVYVSWILGNMSLKDFMLQ